MQAVFLFAHPETVSPAILVGGGKRQRAAPTHKSQLQIFHLHLQLLVGSICDRTLLVGGGERQRTAPTHNGQLQIFQIHLLHLQLLVGSTPIR